MSYSTLYEVESSGDVRPVADFPNAFAGAWTIWADIAAKHGVAGIGEGYFLLSDPVRMKAIWDLAYDPAVPRHRRIALLATFDHHLCEAGRFPELVAAFRRFDGELRTGRGESHLIPWATAIEAFPPDALGCGWRHTSVISCPWTTYDPDDAEADGRPYNVHVGDKHRWIFRELEREGGL